MDNQLIKTMEEDFPVFLKAFQEFIRVPSISGQGSEDYKHPQRIFSLLEETCKNWGLDIEIIENEVAEVSQGSGEKDIGVLLHLDVVPAGDNWKQPPFSGKVAEDAVWGRGSWDNKQPLVICLFALYLFKKMGLQFKRRVRLIMGTHEETGDWSDIALYLKKKNPPNFCLVPDGSFPIGIAEKGFANMQFQGKEKWECPSFKVIELKAGERVNMVPDKASLTIEFNEEISDTQIKEWMKEVPVPSSVTAPDWEIEGKTVRLNFYGKGSHSSAPANGINALFFAFTFLKELCSYHGKDPFPVLDFMHTLTDDIKGEKIGFAAKDEFLGATTGSVSIFSYNQGEIECVQNMRPTTGTTCRETAEKVKQGTEKILQGRASLEVTMKERFKEPLYVDPDENEEYLVPLREVYKKVTGRPPKYIGTPGSTYAKAMPNSILFGPLEEEDGEMFHQSNEKVPFPRLKENMQLYILALYRLLEPR